MRTGHLGAIYQPPPNRLSRQLFVGYIQTNVHLQTASNQRCVHLEKLHRVVPFLQ